MGLNIKNIIVFAVCSVALLTATTASAKDRDGTRLRAKAAKLGKKVHDKLDGNKDKVDWRYIELRTGGELRIQFKLTPKTGGVTARIVDINGKPIAKAACKAGVCTINTEVKPGIYYIAVAAKSSVTYVFEANRR